MRAALTLIGCALAMGALGCGGDPPAGTHDAGHVGPGMDSGTGPGVDAAAPGPDAGPCATDTECPGSYCNPGSHVCCVPTGFEICGDHIDQDCNRHDAPCGDNDHDAFNACTPTDTDLTMCDCDDSDPHTYPAHGSLPGGAEACDMKDNDCDGRVDEAAACCPACMALGETNRGDVCTVSGECACSTAPGMAACPSGQVCCAHGCVDTTTDITNCGSCGFACTTQSDRCVDSMCYCGPPPGVSCTFTTTCHSGACS